MSHTGDCTRKDVESMPWMMLACSRDPSLNSPALRRPRPTGSSSLRRGHELLPRPAASPQDKPYSSSSSRPTQEVLTRVRNPEGSRSAPGAAAKKPKNVHARPRALLHLDSRRRPTHAHDFRTLDGSPPLARREATLRDVHRATRAHCGPAKETPPRPREGGLPVPGGTIL